MRLRYENAMPSNANDEAIIRKVLAVDGFKVNNLEFNNNTVNIMVKNTKFGL